MVVGKKLNALIVTCRMQQHGKHSLGWKLRGVHVSRLLRSRFKCSKSLVRVRSSKTNGGIPRQLGKLYNNLYATLLGYSENYYTGIASMYAFLANCREGASGYVQCWKSSVLSSFLNTEKVILGFFELGGRQFQAVGPAWKNPRGPIVLVKVSGANRSPDAADLRCERPGSEATGMQY